MDRAEEAELVARLRKGDKTALRVVYASFSDRIFGFLLRLSRRRDVAEDLHQETWVSVARHAERLTEGTDLPAWLFTIARNKHRSWRRWAALDFTRLAFDSDGPEPEGPSARPDAGDELAALEQALEALPMAHREVLLLVGVEGLEPKQAAEVLGIQPEALRQRLSRARSALAEKLEGPAQSDAAVVR
ncbi:RNA polymerase sigma factor [Polyangium spumosum]|uniref:Sigma-70 family RNA polymerase sigma factor n=1 Tax=Polyangium spumosum TaxID=889282 RepID=A0A6N7PWZ7_9BACT|nr:RNA polymerase sigma factor [Polyangium spumosum]MRG96608.1 sigma-70 family RNA polymerase sigma factor [Polyangium spumosum]